MGVPGVGFGLLEFRSTWGDAAVWWSREVVQAA